MLKIIGYVAAGLLILVLIGGVGYSLVRKTEGYKAEEQNFYSFEPHFFIGGCARYDATKKDDARMVNKIPKVEVKSEVKKEVKK